MLALHNAKDASQAEDAMLVQIRADTSAIGSVAAQQVPWRACQLTGYRRAQTRLARTAYERALTFGSTAGALRSGSSSAGLRRGHHLECVASEDTDMPHVRPYHAHAVLVRQPADGAGCGFHLDFCRTSLRM